jgi:hypothetical protein
MAQLRKINSYFVTSGDDNKELNTKVGDTDNGGTVNSRRLESSLRSKETGSGNLSQLGGGRRLNKAKQIED